MKKKTFTVQYGRVPGTGEQHTHTSYRPEGEIFAKMEIKDMLNISNVKVVSAAIKNLRIEPTEFGGASRQTYKNGGFNRRNFVTEYYDLAAIELIRDEILSQSERTKTQTKYQYYGITFFSDNEF